MTIPLPIRAARLPTRCLGTASFDWDFSSAPLFLGSFATQVFDLSSFNIVLTDNILVTQQFTEISGASARNGVLLFYESPGPGSSPSTYYFSSSSAAPNLITTFSPPNQVGYRIIVEPVPEPSALALIGLGIAGLFNLRRRQTSK